MKKLFIIAIIITSFFVVVGCDNNKESKTKEKTEETIKVGENTLIVDVRTKEEYNEGHIVNAINIPYDEIDENVELDKDKKIMVYCKSGYRSNIAYEKLKELGYDVEDLGAYENINMKKIK